MKYCGIDVGATNVVAIEDKAGKSLKQFEIGNSRDEYKKLLSRIDKNTKICLEETGIFSRPLFNYLKSRGYNVKRINGKKSKWFRKFLNEREKTDVVDASALAKMRLAEDTLNIVTRSYDNYNDSDLKSITRLYHFIQKQKEKLLKRVTSMIFVVCPELWDNFYRPVNKTVMVMLKYYLPEEMGSITFDKARARILPNEPILLRKEAVEKTIRSFNNSIGIRNNVPAVRFAIEQLLASEKLLASLKIKMKEELYKTPYAYLLDADNINVITASVLAGEIGDIDKFPNVKKFVSYCGYDFRREQSGTKDERYVLNANNHIKCAIRNIVPCYLGKGRDNKINKYFERMKEKGKKKRVSLSAACRKLAIHLYFEMKKAKEKYEKYGSYDSRN